MLYPQSQSTYEFYIYVSTHKGQVLSTAWVWNISYLMLYQKLVCNCGFPKIWFQEQEYMFILIIDQPSNCESIA